MMSVVPLISTRWCCGIFSLMPLPVVNFTSLKSPEPISSARWCFSCRTSALLPAYVPLFSRRWFEYVADRHAFHTAPDFEETRSQQGSASCNATSVYAIPATDIVELVLRVSLRVEQIVFSGRRMCRVQVCCRNCVQSPSGFSRWYLVWRFHQTDTQTGWQIILPLDFQELPLHVYITRGYCRA